MTPRLIGAHTSTSGGLQNAITNGLAIGCTSVQLFTSSPRQWNSAPLKDETREAYAAAMLETGIDFTVAHDSYLINLAAPSEEVLAKSKAAFRAELDRAEALGIKWVVTHMGAHMKEGIDVGIGRLIASIREILDETDKLGYRVGIAMETTAGQGTGLGATFEEIAATLAGAEHHPRLGVCLDTCHIFVAGYDIRTPEAYAETFGKFDSIVGKDKLKVLHINDAKKPLGSRVDRHEHLGQGEIGAEGFRLLVNDPTLAHLPLIVETPETDDYGHEQNVAFLKGLIQA